MKGNAILAQSGGPTAVINASLYGLIEGCKEVKSIGNIYGMRFGIEGFLRGTYVDVQGESEAELSKLMQTPSSALGSCRYKLQDADLPVILDYFQRLGIRYCFMIGGNDTMDTIARIEGYCRKEGYELHGVGVPKTVDNDLFGTDHTPGYPSAALYVALSVQQSGRLAADMQKVDKLVVHQTIGRDAGWLAASAAQAAREPSDAPHVIYVPERPVTQDQVVQDAQRCIERYGWAYIVVGEGTLWEDGTPVSAASGTDQFSNVEFGAMSGSSAAVNLHRLITKSLDVRGEFQIPESLPMCASDRVSAVDRQEAYECGRRAVDLAASGNSGVMVAIRRESSQPYRAAYTTIELTEVAERTRPMPDAFLSREPPYVSREFLDYLKPLVGPMPQHAVLSLDPITIGS